MLAAPLISSAEVPVLCVANEILDFEYFFLTNNTSAEVQSTGRGKIVLESIENSFYEF